MSFMNLPRPQQNFPKEGRAETVPAFFMAYFLITVGTEAEEKPNLIT